MAYNGYGNLLNQICGTTYDNKREIVSVNGLQEANNYFLGRGENIILRDANEDRIYVKACDEMGKNTLKIYDCVDVTEKILKESIPQQVSRSDFDQLSNELADIKKMFIEVVNGKYNVKQSSECDKFSNTVSKIQTESNS